MPIIFWPSLCFLITLVSVWAWWAHGHRSQVAWVWTWQSYFISASFSFHTCTMRAVIIYVLHRLLWRMSSYENLRIQLLFTSCYWYLASLTKPLYNWAIDFVFASSSNIHLRVSLCHLSFLRAKFSFLSFDFYALKPFSSLLPLLPCSQKVHVWNFQYESGPYG